MFDNLKMKTAISDYIKKYPYKSDGSNIPTGDGLLSVDESDCLKIDLTKQLLLLFAHTEINKPKTNQHPENLQFVLSVSSQAVHFHRHIAFSRLDGMPFLVEKNQTDAGLWASAISFVEYHHLLNDLVRLCALPHVACCVRVETKHQFSMEDLLKIDSANWRDYILPVSELPGDGSWETDAAWHETTVEDLFGSQRLYAVYQHQTYRLFGAVNELGFHDYVARLQDENGSFFFVDIRALCDVYQKEYYIQAKDKWFKVELVGKNQVIVEYQPSENNEPYGFVSLHSKGMGPGWEVDGALIESVKYKKKSIYQQILHRLR